MVVSAFKIVRSEASNIDWLKDLAEDLFGKFQVFHMKIVQQSIR
jgi:hypothetical protein